MQLPGCYNKELIEAVDICDPVDVALMADLQVEDSIMEDEMEDAEIDAMMDEVEDGINTDENDEMYNTSADPLDIEIDEEIKAMVEWGEDETLFDTVFGEI